MIISTEDPIAVAVVEAIHTGDVERLRRLLRENPGLATASSEATMTATTAA